MTTFHTPVTEMLAAPTQHSLMPYNTMHVAALPTIATKGSTLAGLGGRFYQSPVKGITL